MTSIILLAGVRAVRTTRGGSRDHRRSSDQPRDGWSARPPPRAAPRAAFQDRCLMSVHVESPPPARRVQAPAPDGAPLVEVLERYQDAGTAPFSGPGHKLGTGGLREGAAR